MKYRLIKQLILQKKPERGGTPAIEKKTIVRLRVKKIFFNPEAVQLAKNLGLPLFFDEANNNSAKVKSVKKT